MGLWDQAPCSAGSLLEDSLPLFLINKSLRKKKKKEELLPSVKIIPDPMTRSIV